MLKDMPMFGMGTRVSKSSWHDDSFWHIVDVRPKPPPKSRAGNVSAHAAGSAESGDAAAKGGGFRARVYGVKFWNGVPETGKVVLVRGSKQRVWRRVGVDEETGRSAAALSKVARGIGLRLKAAADTAGAGAVEAAVDGA